MAVTTYATLLELKGALGPTKPAEDANLTDALNGASGAINDVTGRRFWRDDTVNPRTLNPAGRSVWTSNGEHKLLTKDIAVSTDMIVETGKAGSAPGWTVATAYEPFYRDDAQENDGQPITGLILYNGEWSCGQGSRVRITAVWGWPAVPAAIKSATLILARRLYARKDSPGGIMGSQEWVINLAKRDPDVQSLIERYQLPGFG